MKIELLGIALILFGIALMQVSSGSETMTLCLVISFLGLMITIIGAIKPDKK